MALYGYWPAFVEADVSFDAALMAAMQHRDERVANPVEIVPGGMMPPDFLPP